jgi:AraC-like DNA-binding protein
MKVNEKGVLEESEIFFHNPSQLSKNLFNSIICCGNFTCNNHYKVKRATYNSYLLIFVLKGNGYYKKDNKIINLKTNSLTLINCYESHEYGTHSGWKFYWVHFDGPQAKCWFEHIHNKSQDYKDVINSLQLISTMKGIIDCLKYNNGSQEALINKYIVNILSEFLIEEKVTEKPFQSIVGYINNNLNEKITIKELAKRACMSEYHFIRKFYKEVGYTPYEFIINSRINASKFYLTTTSKSIQEILYICGFKDSSAFSTAFKKIVKMPPSKFRQLNKR